MSFAFSQLELRSMNLTFWVTSETVEFGRYVFNGETLQHEAGFDSKIRFHKPTQNLSDPTEFLIRSVCKVIDGIRGPIRAIDGTQRPLRSNELSDIRFLLKSLRNDSNCFLNEVLLSHPLLTIKQILSPEVVVTHKDLPPNRAVVRHPYIQGKPIVLDNVRGAAGPFSFEISTPHPTRVLFEDPSVRITFIAGSQL